MRKETAFDGVVLRAVWWIVSHANLQTNRLTELLEIVLKNVLRACWFNRMFSQAPEFRSAKRGGGQLVLGARRTGAIGPALRERGEPRGEAVRGVV